jgi:SAM-dependent methyltransferase
MLAATTDLRELPDASVDVAIADGSLPAAAGTRQLRRALAEVHRVVVPGGLVLVRQVNRPRSLALRMRGALRHAGFRELRIIGYAASERHLAGWRRHLDPTFAIVARRPGEPVIRAELPAASSPRGRPPRGRPPLRVAFPEEVSAVFAHHVRGHLRERGVAAASAARTVRINSTLAPERARQLLELLRQHLGIMSLEDRRVLELGCGFGALAAQLAILDRPASIVAVDNDERQLTVARACVQELGLAPPVDVRRLDMRSLEGIEVGSIELALVNNAFPYLPTAADADRALAEIARVLAPGAGVLFYHANRWRLTEPFTGAPLLHLLPPAIGKPLSAVTRLRLSHGRVRLLSAAELRRRLREVGLEPAGTTGFLRGPRTAPVVRELGTYYAVAARKPQQ